MFDVDQLGRLRVDAAHDEGLVQAGTPMATPKNERNTENIVRDELRRLGYYKKPIVVEEQKSQIEAVKRLMKAASKSGGGGIGYPEFIISSSTDPDFLVMVECKADPKDHISPLLRTGRKPDSEENEEEYTKRAQRFGVDGALHYSQVSVKGVQRHRGCRERRGG